jgi:hypothetical protein
MQVTAFERKKQEEEQRRPAHLSSGRRIIKKGATIEKLEASAVMASLRLQSQLLLQEQMVAQFGLFC